MRRAGGGPRRPHAGGARALRGGHGDRRQPRPLAERGPRAGFAGQRGGRPRDRRDGQARRVPRCSGTNPDGERPGGTRAQRGGPDAGGRAPGAPNRARRGRDRAPRRRRRSGRRAGGDARRRGAGRGRRDHRRRRHRISGARTRLPRGAGRATRATVLRGIATHDIGSGVAFEAWGRGELVGGAALLAGRSYWFYEAPSARVDPSDPLGAVGAERWPEPTRAQLAATPAEAVLVNRILRLDPLPTWTRGTAALLGDAAHAMEPNLGQGAAQAIEDAESLLVALRGGGELADARPPTRRPPAARSHVPARVLALRTGRPRPARRPAQPGAAAEPRGRATARNGAPAAPPRRSSPCLEQRLRARTLPIASAPTPTTSAAASAVATTGARRAHRRAAPRIRHAQGTAAIRGSGERRRAASAVASTATSKAAERLDRNHRPKKVVSRSSGILRATSGKWARRRARRQTPRLAVKTA